MLSYIFTIFGPLRQCCLEAGAAASPGSAARAAIPFQLVEWLGRSMSHKSHILRYVKTAGAWSTARARGAASADRRVERGVKLTGRTVIPQPINLFIR